MSTRRSSVSVTVQVRCSDCNVWLGQFDLPIDHDGDIVWLDLDLTDSKETERAKGGAVWFDSLAVPRVFCGDCNQRRKHEQNG